MILSNMEMFPRGFPFKTDPLHQRVVHGDRAGSRTFHDATAVIPAFIGIDHDRRSAFFRIRDKDIHETDLYTTVAAIAPLIIKYQRMTRGYLIRGGIDFISGHGTTPYCGSSRRLWVS
jgi:hypothetical protein